MTYQQRKSRNRQNWTLAVILAFGGWLMQQTSDFKWTDLTTPRNVGSLVLIIGGVFASGKGVKDPQ